MQIIMDKELHKQSKIVQSSEGIKLSEEQEAELRSE
jgi:hypothetical protein